jgi:[ribosomal protein S18]-alanine N-acetyltransferase
MTPDDMAALHARAFTTPRPWSAQEFRDLLASPLVFALTEPHGLLLGRVVADEAELLTIAVAPDAQRHGLGRKLVDAFLTEAARRGAVSAFLEVSAQNPAALGLYRAAGFRQTGSRRGYFHGPDGAQDALIMVRNLTR